MGMAILGATGRAVLDFVLPPRCAGCGDITETPGLCAPCFAKVDWLATGCCERCAIPLEATEQGTCLACEAAPPLIAASRAVTRYDDLTRSLVLRLKYGRRVGLVRYMGGAMARRVGELERGTLIAPVPLHRGRLWKRGFNQAGLLAREVGRLGRADVAVDLLQRTRATPPMGKLTPVQRQKSVRGAFRVNPRHDVLGRTILLVDDVRTSGATLEACAKALLAAGAGRVEAILWARVVRARDITR